VSYGYIAVSVGFEILPYKQKSLTWAEMSWEFGWELKSQGKPGSYHIGYWEYLSSQLGYELVSIPGISYNEITQEEVPSIELTWVRLTASNTLEEYIARP
jgi:hypothetical protein